MKLINAFLYHASLVLLLKHNGKGMPKEIPAALALALAYCSLAILNLNLENFDFQTACCLLFIVQFYVFLYRNTLLGLIFMIGIISNALHLIITYTALPQEISILLSIFEYVMILFSVVNTLKSNYQIT